MIKSREVTSFLFKTVCIVFSLFMLLMSLFAKAAQMESEGRCAEYLERIKLTEAENKSLRLKLENRLSLQELEYLAREELGMTRPSAENIFYTACP